MHDWNQEKFDGLSSIGDACALDANLEFFARYCLLREKGLRKEAIKAALLFVTHLQSLELGTQRDTAIRLVQLQHLNPGTHQLLPHPIKIELIGILRAWSESTPDEVLPRLSLGLLSDDIEHFEAVLRLQPNEQTALMRLAQFHINNLDFQVHHLSESRFIGTIDDANESLRQAELLVGQLANPLQSTALKNELKNYQVLVSEWATYSTERPAEPFLQWSHSRGNTFSLPYAVYYSK